MTRTPHDILLTVLAAAWRRRRLWAWPLLVMPVVGLVVSFLIPKVYESKMTIVIQEPAKLNPFMRDFSIGPNVKERMPTLQALLHSDHVLGQVAIDLGMVPAKADRRQREAAVKALSGATKVDLVGGDILELKIRGPRPDGLGRTLETIGNRLIERLVAPERSAVGDSERFLTEQLGLRRAELEAAEKALADFKTSNAALLPSVYSSSLARLTDLKGKLEERSLALATAEAAFNDLRTRLVSTNPVIGRLEQEIVQVSGELSTLQSRYTGDHSEVVGAQRKLQRLQDERRQLIEATRGIDLNDLDRLWNMAAGMGEGDKKATPLLVTQMQNLQEAQSKRAALAKEVEQLRAAITDTQANMASFAPIEQRQQALERALASAREAHDSLAKRYEMARVTGALGVFEAPERVKVVDASGDPLGPTSLPRIVFLLGGLGAALALGVALSIMAELFDPMVRNAPDFAELLGVPLLGRLPRFHPARP
ncbi:MAG: hypothetical protein LCH95_11810 [Proteobacteria bacterium]|nr:hypothetical protein [Pseudomonadota bacterium]